jgi:hypothetical protein
LTLQQNVYALITGESRLLVAQTKFSVKATALCLTYFAFLLLSSSDSLISLPSISALLANYLMFLPSEGRACICILIIFLPIYLMLLICYGESVNAPCCTMNEHYDPTLHGQAMCPCHIDTHSHLTITVYFPGK